MTVHGSPDFNACIVMHVAVITIYSDSDMQIDADRDMFCNYSLYIEERHTSWLISIAKIFTKQFYNNPVQLSTKSIIQNPVIGIYW